jgi:hypothetical protein
MTKIIQTLILYPRSYNKRGQENLHSVQGITLDGRDVNVKLRLSDEKREEYNQSEKTAPSIAEFSKTDLMAKMACIALDNNGPELGSKCEGMLFFRDVFEEKVGVFIAGDARVIRVNSYEAMPIIGVGRMEIEKNTYDVLNAKEKLSKLSEGQEDERAQLLETIESPYNYHYRSIIYHHEDSSIFKDEVTFREVFANFIDKNTKNGGIGGVLLKAYNQDGKVIDRYTREYFSLYHAGKGTYQTGYEMVKHVDHELSPLLNKLGDDVQSVMIMPVLKYLSGARGNKVYADRYEKLVANFYHEGVPVITDVVVTIKYIQEGESALLSKVHVMTDRKASVSELSNDGTFRDVTDSNKEVISIHGDMRFTPYGIVKKANEFIVDDVASNEPDITDIVIKEVMPTEDEMVLSDIPEPKLKVKEATEVVILPETPLIELSESEEKPVTAPKKATGMAAFMKNKKSKGSSDTK